MEILLLVDLGNGYLKLAIYDKKNQKKLDFYKISRKIYEEIPILKNELKKQIGTKWNKKISSGFMVGVVATSIEPVRQALSDFFENNVYALTSKMKKKLWSNICDIAGADLLMGWIALKRRFPKGGIAVSLGTATVVSVVRPPVVYPGAEIYIFSGLQLSLRAALNDPNREFPTTQRWHLIDNPKTREESIESGVMAAQCGALTKIISDVQATSSTKLPVVVYGGNIKTMQPYLMSEWIVDRDHVWTGMLLAWKSINQHWKMSKNL